MSSTGEIADWLQVTYWLILRHLQPISCWVSDVMSFQHQPLGILTSFDEKGSYTTINGKIQFKKGIITIKEYGFYHIYSQVFFQADEEGIDPHLCHYVYHFRKHRYNPDSTKYIILRGFSTKPDHVPRGQGFYTTSANGVFRLMEGDQLAIGVDPAHMPLISYAESATFFGAYMIWSCAHALLLLKTKVRRGVNLCSSGVKKDCG